MNDKRAMNRGLGDGMSRAFELVATPALFALVGLGIDRLVGSSPVFVLAFGLFGVVGTFVRFWYGYDAEMRSHEASSRWAPRTAHSTRETPDDPPSDLWQSGRAGADA